MRRLPAFLAAAVGLAAAALAYGAPGAPVAPSRALDAAPAASAAPAAGAGRAPAYDDSTVRALFPGLANGACPVPGVVTGGRMDSAHVATLAREGFRTVLDLRAPREMRGFDEIAALEAAGIRYERVPVVPATLGDAEFDRVRALLSDERRAPFFVHCASGNRVGALLVPWLALDRGWSRDDAVAAARRMGLRSDALLAKADAYLARRARGAGRD